MRNTFWIIPYVWRRLPEHSSGTSPRHLLLQQVQIHLLEQVQRHLPEQDQRHLWHHVSSEIPSRRFFKFRRSILEHFVSPDNFWRINYKSPETFSELFCWFRDIFWDITQVWKCILEISVIPFRRKQKYGGNRLQCTNYLTCGIFPFCCVRNFEQIPKCVVFTIRLMACKYII